MEQNCNNLVIINYEDLLSESSEPLLPLLARAFGSDSDGGADDDGNGNGDGDNSSNTEPTSPPPALGLIAIRGIPSFVETKQKFLPLAHSLVNLPSDYLEENLTDAASFYSSGYSFGKEKLGHKPDISKASFYFNPVTDVPGTAQERKDYPASYPVNKWPEKKNKKRKGENGNGNDNCNDNGNESDSDSNSVEELVPGLKKLGKEMGCLMREVVALLAHHVDNYVVSCTGSGTGTGTGTARPSGYSPTMGREMRHTEKVKGRLLYYFPLDDDGGCASGDGDGDVADDSWIGWHNDSGFFTALAGDMYLDHETGAPLPRKSIDPQAGLYIMDRNGLVTKVDIPEDCMAIQIGECMQIITGGKVVATPHCVRGADPSWTVKYRENDGDRDNDGECDGNDETTNERISKVARISFPCFVDTVPSFPLRVPDTSSRKIVLKSSVGCADKVPPLEGRWKKDGMDFGSFLHDTFAMYYEWSNNKKD